MPSCNLSPFLFNGHLQTIWTAFKPSDSVPVYYKRRIFEQSDPGYAGTFAVDFVVHDPFPADAPDHDAGLPERTKYFTDKEWAEDMEPGSADQRPMLVLLHGLSGGSHEIYLREVLKPLIDDHRSLPWEACVVTSRGCAGSNISTNILYNARATWDTRMLISWLREKYPNRPLFGIGFSLGANILGNYLGEEGSSCPLKAALLVSSPFNLEAASLGLQSSWVGLQVYSKVMAKNMRGLIERHVKEITKNTKIDIEAVRNITYLHEFDRAIQCPTWGYPTEGAYYRDASSTDALMAIRIPFLCISALDDPISVRQALPFEEIKTTPYGVLCTTSLGGHLSWFQLGGGRWFAKVATSFFQALANQLDFDHPFQVPSQEPVDASEGDPWISRFDPMRRKMFRRAMADQGSHRA